MLKKFFYLNGDPEGYKSIKQLHVALKKPHDIEDVIYYPDTLSLEELEGCEPSDSRTKFFEDKTFKNVSFSRTTISGLTFKNCKFIDCLFTWTKFNECRFSDTKFKDCNTHRVQFNDTYVDPRIFEDMIDRKIYRKKYTNIGVHLFQNLYDNAMKTNQRKFAQTAEFNMHLWKRYRLNSNYRGWKKLNARYIFEWSKSMFWNWSIGYGIRAKYWLAWAAIIGTISYAVNYFLWDCLKVVDKNDVTLRGDWFNVLLYTAANLGGFGLFTPGSNWGNVVFVVEAGFGLIIIGLVLAWLIQQVLR